jgi:hypothetical protein
VSEYLGKHKIDKRDNMLKPGDSVSLVSRLAIISEEKTLPKHTTLIVKMNVDDATWIPEGEPLQAYFERLLPRALSAKGIHVSDIQVEVE